MEDAEGLLQTSKEILSGPLRSDFEAVFWETFEEIFGRHVGQTMRAVLANRAASYPGDLTEVERAILALRELFGDQARTVEQQVLSRLRARVRSQGKEWSPAELGLHP